MSRLFLASLGFSWLLIASADDLCSSMETEGRSGCSNRKGIGAALLQTNLHASMQVFAGEVDAKKGKTTLANTLEFVTRLVDKSGGHSWNMTEDEKDAIEAIRGMINDLFDHSKTQHGEDQFEVDGARNRITQCTDDLHREQDNAITRNNEHANESRYSHSDCRVRENTAIANTHRECTEYHDYRKNPSFFNPFPTCLSTDLTYNHIKSDVAVEKQNMEECLVKTVDMLKPLYEHYLECKEANDLRKQVALECDNKQGTFERDYCAYSGELDSACNAYSLCRHNQKAARNDTHAAVRKSEEARKADWETGERILCLLDVFFDDNSNKAGELEACKDAESNTTVIDITYHDVPAAEACPGDWRDDEPCDEAWLETEYRTQDWYNSSSIAACSPCAP